MYTILYILEGVQPKLFRIINIYIKKLKYALLKLTYLNEYFVFKLRFKSISNNLPIWSRANEPPLTLLSKTYFTVKFNFKVFTGNFDMNTPVTNYLLTPVVTSYIRIYQEEVNQGNGAIRMEILGCQSDGEDISSTPDDSNL